MNLPVAVKNTPKQKDTYQIFLLESSFTKLLLFLSNILFGIVNLMEFVLDIKIINLQEYPYVGKNKVILQFKQSEFIYLDNFGFEHDSKNVFYDK